MQIKMGRKKQEAQPKKAANEATNTDRLSASSPHAELKAKIESVLFCIPEGVTADLLAHKVNMSSKEKIQSALSELQKDYEMREGGLKIISDEKGVWRFKVPDEHIPFIQTAAEPEFDRAVLETLAYIAWRGGSRQCDVVRVRGNKAYNHIKLLKEKGFIESHRSGLSKWLELTKKFNEYFNLKQGEKLPVPEDVEKIAEETEKAAAAAKLHEDEIKMQQAKVLANLKKEEPEDGDSEESGKNGPDGEESENEEPESDGDITPEEEPEGSDEEPEEEEEFNKAESDDSASPATRENPDNE